MKVHEQHKQKAKQIIKIALIVVSTSRFDEVKNNVVSTDKTIPKVKEILKNNDRILLDYTKIIPDSAKQIESILNELLDNSFIDTIIFSGGTGITPKDITYETVEPLLEKKITGFGELFRYLYYEEIGSSAMLSRALAGKIKNKAIFLLPGSPNAVKLALNKLIIPELGHIIYLINKDEWLKWKD